MFQNFLLSLTILAHILGLTLPQALTADHYIVPTVPEAAVIEATMPMEPLRVVTAPIPRDRDRGPALESRAALVLDKDSRVILWQKNPMQEMPIASITKLATAMVWLDHQPVDGWDHVHTFAPEEDTPEGKELDLPYGEKLRARDLLRSALVGSDNDTALALAHTTALSDAAFVALMNERAQQLGLRHTTFVDATGLSARNTSTVRDIALLAAAAFDKEEIRIPSTMTEHRQTTVDTTKEMRVFSTNKLLRDDDIMITGGKTGFTNEAGYCVVIQARVPDTEREVVVVILGAPTDSARFTEAKTLFQWAVDHYNWR